MANRVVREGSTIIVNASQKHTATVILTHGLGDTADGWRDAAMHMASLVPHVKWVLPTAPSQPVTLNGGMRMPSWYDIESLSRSRGTQECKGLDDSRAKIMSIVDSEREKGIDTSRIVLAGFSQGGALSLWTGLQIPETYTKPLAGVLCLSGYLPKSDAFSLSSHGRVTPVFHCHGSVDPVVIPDFAEVSKQQVDAAGHTAGYELKWYRGMAHSASMEELGDVVNWLKKVVPQVE
jgi:lysophospholipase-2